MPAGKPRPSACRLGPATSPPPTSSPPPKSNSKTPMPSFVLGIDLGTTNSVLAYAPLAGKKPEVKILPIPQLVAPGVVEERTSLPSFIYLPPEQEASSGAY